MTKINFKTTAAILLMPAFAAAQTALSKGIQVNDVFIDQVIIAQELWTRFGASVVQQLIDNELIKQEAKANKIQADSREVSARIARLKEQVGQDFEKKLQENGLTQQNLRAQISQQVLLEDLLKKTKNIAVTEKELKDSYEANKNNLGAPEQIRLRHIQVASQREAEDILIALRAGANFGKLAQAKSLDQPTAAKSGELGLFSRGMLVPQIEQAAFALKTGEYGGPVQTQIGFHIIYVAEKIPAKPPQFNAVKENLRTALLQQKINQVLPGHLQELRAKARVSSNL